MLLTIQVSIVYRDDVIELKSACEAAVAAAENELLPVQDYIAMTSSTDQTIQGRLKVAVSTPDLLLRVIECTCRLH